MLGTVTSTAVVIAALLVIGCLIFAAMGFRHGEMLKALEMERSADNRLVRETVSPLYASKMNPLYASNDDLVEPGDDNDSYDEVQSNYDNDSYDEVQFSYDADEVDGYLEVDGFANDPYDST